MKAVFCFLCLIFFPFLFVYKKKEEKERIEKNEGGLRGFRGMGEVSK